MIRDAAVALGAAVMVSILFYSSFFTNARGPLDSVLTYGNYFTRASGGNEHDKPWDYYLKLLLWRPGQKTLFLRETFILLMAAAGALLPRMTNDECRVTNERLLQSKALMRFFAVYTLVLAVAYSAIAYKTPWCVLGILHGLILLSGIGAANVFDRQSRVWMKLAAAFLGLAIFSYLMGQAKRTWREDDELI